MKYKLLSFCSLVVLCIIGVSGRVSADVNNFLINNFRADYHINNYGRGGSMETTEQIDLTFTDQNHGILRAIPKKYHGYSTNLQIVEVLRDGQKEPYTTSSSGGNLVLKIGDANRTITGKHTYKLRYLQQGIINFNGDLQSFYWDTNGDQWKQNFEKVEAHLIVTGAHLESSKAHCYTGARGSQATNCTVKEENGELVFATNQPLSPSENMSIETPITGVSFVRPSTADWIKGNFVIILDIFLAVVGFASAFGLWLKFGKDYHGRGVIVPEYEPPVGLGPAEVGMLADYKVDGRDISSTLIDLAVRKYIRLHDDSKKVLFFTSRNYRLELLNADFSALKPHEVQLLNALFETKAPGEIIEMSSLDHTTMYSAVQTIRKDISNDLVKKYGYIESRGNTLQVAMLSVGIVLGFVFLVAFIAAGSWGISGIVGGGSLILFGLLMKRRTHAGVEMYEKVKGLELYMKTAEADRLKMMQSVERPYAEPQKTVELFEKLLPFAVALGVEKSWAKQFDDVLSGEPDWYTGNNLSTFNASYLASSLTSATSSFSSSFEASSGSSGGSGGGGGGGGGGGW